MIRQLLTIFLFLLPAGAAATPTADFINRWAIQRDATERRVRAVHQNASDAAKAFSEAPELAPFANEFAEVSTKYWKNVQKSLSVGKPRACLPDQFQMDIDTAISDIKRLPVAWLERDFAESFAEAMDQRYRCSQLTAVEAREKSYVSSSLDNVKLRPNAATVAVPIEIVNGNIVFQATINGVVATVLLDTGSSKTLIDPVFAKKIGLTFGPVEGSIKAGKSNIPARRTSDALFDMANVISLRGALVAIDLTPTSAFLHRHIDAVLGENVTSLIALKILPTRKQMSLGESGSFATPTHNILVLPIENRNEVDAKVNGVPVRLKIDLGSQGYISLSKAAWKRVGLDGSPSVERKMFGTTDGNIHEALVINTKVAFGGIILPDIVVSQSPHSSSSDGEIGGSFLLRRPIVIDAPAKKVMIALPK